MTKCIFETVIAIVMHKCDIYQGEKIDTSRHFGIICVIYNHVIAFAQFYCLPVELCPHNGAVILL